MKNNVINKNEVKEFIDYMRCNIQDDALAYDEIITLTECDGIKFIERLNKEYKRLDSYRYARSKY